MSTQQHLVAASRPLAKTPRNAKEQDEFVAALDPGTVALFVSLGAQVLNFAGQLIGGSTGGALSEIAGQINGLGYKIQDIANQTQKLLMGVEETINSIDKQSLSVAWPVHDQMMAYRKAFPQGVPALADTGNGNYIDAQGRSSQALFYFQGLKRGALAFMPTLCHVTNTRLEVATAWQCWWRQNDAAQPHFAGELNLSSGQLASNIATARPYIGKGVAVKAIFPAHIKGPGNDPIPAEPIGYKVVDGGAVIWQKMGEGPEVLQEANNRAAGRRAQKPKEVLSNYSSTHDRWANMVANFAPAGIQRALNLGDARQFMRYVNPHSLVMQDVTSEDAADASPAVYRALPMRAILLDLLSSKAMRDRHGLLMKGADSRSIRFWFEKTFTRTPTADEMNALMKVVDIFGYQSLFGCLAYSNEYSKRFGDGLPATELSGSDLIIEAEVVHRS